MQRQQSKYPSKHPRNYSKEDVQARHNMAPADAARHAIRLSNLKKLSRAFKDDDKLAIALELKPSRLAELLSGRSPITAEMAMHIEDELHLAGGWLSNPTSEYSVKQASEKVEESEAAAAAKPARGKPAKPQALQAAAAPPTVARLTLPSKSASPKAAAPAKPVTTAPAPTPKATVAKKPASPAPAPKVAAAKKPTPPVSKSKPAATPTPAPASVKASTSEESAQQVRRMNMHILTEEKGEKAALARALNVHESLISLKLKSRPLTRDFCEGIEKAYGLESGWMDIPRLDLPEGVKRLGGDLRRGRPITTTQKPAPAAKGKPAAVRAAPAVKPPAAARPAPKPAVAAPAPTPAPVQPAQAAQPMPAFGATTSALFGKMLAETIISRSASGALSYEKLVRIMEDVMA